MVESIWEFLNSCSLTLAPDRPGHTLTGVSEPQALVRCLLSLFLKLRLQSLKKTWPAPLLTVLA